MMGNFMGHVIPSCFFMIFALWWMMDTLNCYFRPKNKRKQFKSRIMQYVTCCQGRRQVTPMAWIIVVVTIIGIIFEILLSPLHAGSSPNAGNIQHASMYFCFCLVGLQALVTNHCTPLSQRRQLEYISFLMALSVEALLFRFHLDGRGHVDVAMHTMLMYVLYAAVLVTIAELHKENSVILPLARSFLTMLQGTWFMQLAFTLYNPWTDPWGRHLSSMTTHVTSSPNESLGDNNEDMTSHHMTMKVASVFSWHISAMFCCYVSIFLAYHKRYGPSKGYRHNSAEMARGAEEYMERQDEAEQQLLSTTRIE